MRNISLCSCNALGRFSSTSMAAWGRSLGTEHSQGSQSCSMGPELQSPITLPWGASSSVRVKSPLGVVLGHPGGQHLLQGHLCPPRCSLDSRRGTRKTFKEIKNELRLLRVPTLPSAFCACPPCPQQGHPHQHCCHSICHHLGCTCPQSDDNHTKSTHFLLLPLTRELLPPEAGLIPVINSATLAINRKCPNYCFSSYGVTVKSH